MTNRLKSFILLLFLSSFSYAQTNEASPSDNPSTEKPKQEFIFKPTIGLGTGMFSFYGDLYTKHFQSPTISRIGYDLSLSQRISDNLQFNFYVLFGKLGANERNVGTNNRNLNFESQINIGGLNLMYNFGNFLPKDRSASPYITLGIESLEFLSKTDLYDKNGKAYYYWQDGSIRSIDENDPNATQAYTLRRDYKYETDIREMNKDGFGKYPERTWAVPIGAGAVFKLNDYWDFKIGATMHFTFTDYLDGVTKNSKGDRVGNSKNDNFMMTSFSLHYNFGLKKDEGGMDKDNYADIDFLALEQDDQDKDGVLDITDSCQGTPEGVIVDAKGCPIDDDSDGVPNYMDDEINSPVGAFVDVKGVQMSDSLISYQYNYYMDSTGAFAKVETYDHNGNLYSTGLQKEYTVQLGIFKKGLSPELMTKFLSINDINTSNIDDSTTIYTAGKFNNLLDAEKRKQQLVSEGLTDAIVVYKQNGRYFDAPANTGNTTVTVNSNLNNKNISSNEEESNKKAGNEKSTGVKSVTKTKSSNNSNQALDNEKSTANSNAKGLVLRIQLGAYANRLSKNVFKNVNDVIEVRTEDGLYKYMSGSFTTFEAAAKHKVDLVLIGYRGAFVTAYKDGKRVSLKEAGATLRKKEEIGVNDNLAVNVVDKKLVVFKIQLGVFKNDPPADKLEKFNIIKGLSGETTAAGMNRYIVGPFSDYKAAQAAKNDITKNYGLEDAFIIAFFNNEYISVQEALELLK